MLISRRSMLSTASVGIAALGASRLLADGPALRPPDADADPNLPFQHPAQAREIVGASHGNIARVRGLLAERPELAKAAYDWGFGDWETALGAASHVGNREIAALLIEHGARPDLFSFAMLGQLDVVKAYIAANPGIQKVLGPHGITLLSHAKAGGEKSAAVVKYLVELGDADIGHTNLPLTDEAKKLYLGDYGGSDSKGRVIVKTMTIGALSIQSGEKGAPRRLAHIAEHTFHPAGAPATRIVFDVKAGAVSGVTITDGPSKTRFQRM